MPSQFRAFIVIALSAVALSATSPSPALPRAAALSASWSALKSDLLDWPSGQLGFSGHFGPFGGGLYLVPGVTGSHDPGADISAGGIHLNLLYMLPAGDRFIPFVEGGVAGNAFRVDVLDRTAGGQSPARDRTTYLRGGFQLGAGFDLALGGSWSVVAGVRRTWLEDIVTEHVMRDGRVAGVEEDPSYWELPRIAIVYWY